MISVYEAFYIIVIQYLDPEEENEEQRFKDLQKIYNVFNFFVNKIGSYTGEGVELYIKMVEDIRARRYGDLQLEYRIMKSSAILLELVQDYLNNDRLQDKRIMRL